MTRKFKSGDEVVYLGKRRVNAAQAGARAIVVGYGTSFELWEEDADAEDKTVWLHVMWIPGPLVNGQMDGGYYEDDFDLATTVVETKHKAYMVVRGAEVLGEFLTVPEAETFALQEAKTTWGKYLIVGKISYVETSHEAKLHRLV